MTLNSVYTKNRTPSGCLFEAHPSRPQTLFKLLFFIAIATQDPPV
jgi:hypothetical protein